MPRTSKLKVLLIGVVLTILTARFEAQNSITGKWVWAGGRGWQRMTLDLSASGNRLSGTISLGPGSKASNAADWEYFFEPAIFPITNGMINGSTITFEQSLSLSAPMRGNTSGGDRKNPDTLKYFGEIQGDSIIMTRESPSKVNDPFALGNHKFRFIVRRSGSTAAGGSTPAAAAAPPTNRTPVAVSLDVEVLDKAGAAVLSLTKNDFVVREDGAVRPVLNMIPPTAPLNVLMMFDHNLTWLRDTGRGNTGDVRAAWERLFQSSLTFLGRLRADDRFSMGVFEETAKPVLDWRAIGGRQVSAYLGEVMRSPGGQKDVYGMIRWAVTRFAGKNGRKSLVVFTDGRDGRLSPIWFRDSRQREVLDPLFGLADEGEAQEFSETLDIVKQSGVKLHFLVINSDLDPEFGPAVVGRRISGLYPGSTEGIRDYIAGVRSRLKQLAEISGGRVLYGNSAQDASLLYRDLHQELGIGRVYTLEFLAAKPADGAFRSLEASVADQALRLTQYQTGYIAR
jgi:hypothetical protein